MATVNSPSRRVLVLSANPTLFEESLAHMLATQADLLVSRQVYVNAAGLMPTVLRDEPDVILVAESSGLEIAELLATLPEASETHHCPCLVCVRLDDALVDLYEPNHNQTGGIYQHHRFDVTNRHEFLQIVHGGSDLLMTDIPVSVTV